MLYTAHNNRQKVKVLDYIDAWSEGVVAFSNIQLRLESINLLLTHRSTYYRFFPSGQNVFCTLFLNICRVKPRTPGLEL
jgi:hypothetical protein